MAKTEPQPVRTEPAPVRPRAYTARDWPIGGTSPRTVTRPYQADGTLGDPQDGDLRPGQAGVVVTVEGAPITRSVLAHLGL